MPQDIWEEYGYARDPFEPRALSATGEDANLFIGRDEEVEQLATWYLSSRTGGIVVEGPIGVGKTTLVNIAQHRSHVHSGKILPCLKSVECQNGMTPQMFLLEVLAHTLYSLGRVEPKVTKEEEFLRLHRAVERGVVTSRGWQGHLSIHGFAGGAGRQATQTPTQPDELTMMSVHGHLEKFRDFAHKHGYDRILVSINNLDIVEITDFKALLQAVRDSSLALEGYLWTFIGPVGLRSELADSGMQRVSELLRGAAVELGPLSLTQVEKAIEARLKAYQQDSNAIPPVDMEVVEFLYEASSGEIRYVLNRCGDIVEAVTRHLPGPLTVTLDKAKWVLRDIVSSNIDYVRLKPREKEVLRRVAVKRSVQGRDYIEYGFNQYQGLFNHISSLADKGLLVKEKSGRDVIYIPRGDVVLYFEANPMDAWS